ncbi:MAG TPA: Gfo/Idh/MocA family oxidoreductase, partial [Polyangiaceae bacterium]
AEAQLTGEAPLKKLPPLLASSEPEKGDAPEARPPNQRLGVAVVGLGHLALQQILPAFGASQLCKVAALVTGDADKGHAVAARYGVNPKNILNYANYDRLKELAEIDLVYIALPNSMHAEFTVRAAHAGKHVLCEKPMATSVSDCQRMIAACAEAKKKLMIAYRMQYEPYNREMIRLARSGALGKLKSFVASNGQAQGDQQQWRLKKALAGGGALVDVGIYCLNAARYICGEEPIEVQAMQYSTPGDPRFTEVEEQVNFNLRFPSGFTASCYTSYGCHDSKRYRVMGSLGWAELDPAFPYSGQAMRTARKGDKDEAITQPRLEAKNQFALELDHLADCVLTDRKPHTPGEEGMQDMKLIAAIYDAAASGATVKLAPTAGVDPFRGPLEG